MDEQINNWLAQEYLQLQKTVEDFDARALTIKAWSVTFSAAGLGLAYQQHNSVLLLIAALSAIVFWIVEAVKLHQRAFYARIREIEGHFALVGHGGFAPFQILSGWQRSFAGRAPIEDETGLKGKLAVAFFGGVMLPHVVVMAAGVGLYLVCPPA